MKLTIYQKGGTVREIIAPSDNSTLTHAAMGEHVLALSFTLDKYIAFEVNDYVDFEENTYTLLEAPQPSMKSTQEWSYDLKFHGIESELKRALVLKTASGENNPVFSLTAPAKDHIELIAENINRIKGLKKDAVGSWKPGNMIDSGNIVISYNGTTCYDALTQLASQLDTEWWITDNKIHLIRCEYGTENPISLEYQKGLVSLTRNQNENVKFFTRLYPIGSSRNINPADPEKGYGFKRLQLPVDPQTKKRAQFIEQNTHFGIIEHFEEDAFSHIYPRQKDAFIDEVKTANPDKEDPAYTVYYIYDNDLGFDPNKEEHTVPGLTKHIVFESGDLTGYDFEVNYDSKKGCFEIINQSPEGFSQLPGGSLIPRKGDKYLLYNIYMPKKYYEEAEKEFQKAVDDYLKKYSEDKSIYQGETDYIYIQKEKLKLKIGQHVKLVNKELFREDGYRNSRITAITKNVNFPTKMTLDFSDAVAQGKIESLHHEISDVMNFAKSNHVPDIIRSWENTEPNDLNIYSALKSEKEFISKSKDATATGFYKFIQGLDLGTYLRGKQGGSINYKGESELESLLVRKDSETNNLLVKNNSETNNLLVKNLAQILEATIETVGSKTFVNGFTGEGWKIWKSLVTKDYNLEVDRLTVRKAMTVFELIIQKIRSIGGQLIVSAGNGKIKNVVRNGTVYNITFEEKNTFLVNDLLRCQTWTGKNIKYYWVEVSAVNYAGLVTVPVAEFDGAIPEIGDEVVLMGNTKNVKRQNLISISATEDGQPRIDILDNVHTKNFENCLRVRLGNLDGITDTELNPKGNGLYADNVYLKGEFKLSTGEDVKTKLEATEGLIRSQVESVWDDLSTTKSCLRNAYFSKDMNGWETNDDVKFFLAGSKFLNVYDTLLSDKRDFAEIIDDEGQKALYIKNRYILQRNENFNYHPWEFDRNQQGQLLAKTFNVKFYYKCKKSGTLKVEFVNVDQSRYEAFDCMGIETWLGGDDSDYQSFELSGLWNGTGDFKLSYTGEIQIYALRLVEDYIENTEQRLYTSIEQTNEKISFVAGNAERNAENIKNYQAEFTITAKNIRSELSSSVTNLKTNITNEYKSAITQSAKDLQANFTEKINGVDKKVSDIKISADNLTSKFSSLENGLTEHSTTISQMGSRIDLVANKFDKDGNLVNTSGLLTKADGNNLYVLNSKGEIVSLIGQTGNAIKIKAENIELTGVVTVNDNIKMVEGTLHATNATLSGKFETSKEGERIIIEPGSDYRKIKLITSANRVVGSFEFYDIGPRIRGRVRVSEYRKEDDVNMSSCDLNPSGLYVSTFGNQLDITVGSSVSLVTLGLLPTSSQNLPAGTLWRDGNIVKITPI